MCRVPYYMYRWNAVPAGCGLASYIINKRFKAHADQFIVKDLYIGMVDQWLLTHVCSER